MMNFADHGIDIPHSASSAEVQTTCPKCSQQRRKKRVKCLSVNVEKRVWVCHHCGWTGGLGQANEPPHKPIHWRAPRYRRPDPRPKATLPEIALEWFRSRGINEPVLKRNQIDYGLAYMPQVEENLEAVIFPYFRNGALVNRKYRTLSKLFRLESGCELVLYGLDDIESENLVWVEGEVDKLSVEVAGLRSVVSVPNGAPPIGAKDYEARFEFLDADSEKLEAVKRHIIAVDSDAPGRRLETELSRRLGIDKCFRLTWPEGVNDANDMLVKHGAEDLRWLIEHAEPFPIEGVIEISDCRDDLRRLYEHGFERVYSTGWRNLDSLYRVRPREVTGITGIPGSGKSNFEDCLLVNLARLHGWNFAIFSPENLPVQEHMAAIAEKFILKPFNKGSTPRMSMSELETAMAWVKEHFTWILPNDESQWELENILKISRQLCLRRGSRGLVIDPWNELEPLRPSNMTETDYISQSLKRIRVFARQHGVHVWIVVHPAKLQRHDNGKYPVPTLYDCAGSAHWRNKLDNGIVVWRELSDPDSAEVEIHVQKIRFRQVGRRGIARLYYEPVCATYRDYEEPQKSATRSSGRTSRQTAGEDGSK